MKNFRQKIFRQKGMTLLEVLIALVIFSIGLLGVAGLQIVGMKTNHDSLLRTQATQLAQSIAEKMLANEVDVREGEYNASSFPNGSEVITKIETEILDTTSTEMPPLTGLDVMPTSSATIWQADLKEWQEKLNEQLPDGKGLVSCVLDTGGKCDKFSPGIIIVSWQERSNKTDDDANSGQLEDKSVLLNILF